MITVKTFQFSYINIKETSTMTSLLNIHARRMYPVTSIQFKYLQFYSSFVLGFYFAFKKTGIKKDAFLVFYTFLLLHLSYGYGYLLGLIDFIIFNKKPKSSSARLTR